MLAALLSFLVVDGAFAPDARYSVGLCAGDETSAAGCSLTCGGTLVLPNLVVTSRHCADSQPQTAFDCASYRFDGPLVSPTSIWVSSALTIDSGAKFHRGRRWDVPLARSCGHDIAFLELDDAIDATEAVPTAIAIEDNAAERALGALLAIYGYGRTTDEGVVDGNRRRRDAHLLCIGGRDACSAVPEGNTLSPRELAVDALVCPGDSGSGLHVMGGGLLGPLGRSIGGTSPCGYGVYTRLSSHGLLAARVARRAAADIGVPLPAWVATAEAQENRAFGASCDGPEDCDSGMCRSFDGGLAWSCAHSCTSGCEGTCREDACFADVARDSSGCETSRSPIAPSTLPALAGFAMGIAVLRRWRAA